MRAKSNSLAIALVTLVGCHRNEESRVHAGAVVAVANGAIAAIGVESGHTFALEAFGENDAVRFRKSLPCENEPSVAANDDRVFTYCLVHEKNQRLERVAAYSSGSGEELWHHDENATVRASTLRLRVLGDAVVSEGKTHLTVLSTAGAVRAEHATNTQLRGPLVNKNRLTYFTLDTVLSVDTLTGAVTESPSTLRGCVVDGKFWEAVDGRVTSRPVSELGAQKTEVPLEIANLFEVRGCGRYGKALVFEVAVGGEHVAHHHVVKTLDGHTVNYEVDLGPAELETKLLAERPDAVGLNGDELPRFHFLFLDVNQTGQFSSLDLETGRIAAIGLPRSADDVTNVSLFRDQTSWWLVDGLSLQRYSATTGALQGEGTLPSDGFELSPDNVFDGHVWTGSGIWQRGHSNVLKVDVKATTTN